MKSAKRIVFSSLNDRRERLHKAIREKRLLETRAGYDPYSEEARELTLEVVGCTNEIEVLTRLWQKRGGDDSKETADGGGENDLETRYGATGAVADGVDLPAATSRGNTFAGYAAIFDGLADFGDWQEVVRPGAFTKTLRANPDVRFLVNHAGLPLARTTSGTLTLREDSQGLYAEARLEPSDPEVMSIKPKMQRGDLNQMSFAFRVEQDRWSLKKGKSTRELIELSLQDGDVSIVTYPAYPQTRATLRQDRKPFPTDPAHAARERHLYLMQKRAK